jgi:predicted amidophosphoribosyltransferase
MKYKKIEGLDNEIQIFDDWDYLCNKCSHPKDRVYRSCPSCFIIEKHIGSLGPLSFDRIISVGKYFQNKKSKDPSLQSEYNLRHLIKEYKDSPRLLSYCVILLSDCIKQFLSEHSCKKGDIVIACVPDHKSRTYQKAHDLSSAVAKSLDIEYIPLLEKSKNINSQHLSVKTIKDKFANVEGAYGVNSDYNKTFQNKIIFLLDDIVTSTASVHECAKKLKEGGAGKVYIFSLGRTILDSPHDKNEYS